MESCSIPSVDAAQRCMQRCASNEVDWHRHHRAGDSVILKRLEDRRLGCGPSLSEHRVGGIPRDMASAEAIANRRDDRERKEFEKWAVSVTRKPRKTNVKKGADRGIDGGLTFLSRARRAQEVMCSVKSGSVSRARRELAGVIERQGAGRDGDPHHPQAAHKADAPGGDGRGRLRYRGDGRDYRGSRSSQWRICSQARRLRHRLQRSARRRTQVAPPPPPDINRHVPRAVLAPTKGDHLVSPSARKHQSSSHRTSPAPRPPQARPAQAALKST